MIKQETIEEVRSKCDLVTVVGAYTKLKRSGSGYTGTCPFHSEKTPSFHVTPAKGIYKCFGCGKSGDVFSIVMELEKKNFFEAVEHLAAQLNIDVQHDQKAQNVTPEQRDAKKEQHALVQWAYGKYTELLLSLPPDADAMTYMQNRGYTKERMQLWGLGYAPDSWDFLKTTLINQGKFQPSVDCGLVYSAQGKSYDFYRNRIIIPIHDTNGFVIGLAGRKVPTGDAEKDKQYKYLNPCNSLIYNKSKVWYGLWQAKKAIQERGFVYITEGYFDVQSMHDADVINTVASCGTEIDDEQIRILKRHTDHVVLCYDGDKAGIEKSMKQINRFLQQQFKVSVVELPEKMDPDEYVRSIVNTENLVMA